MNAISKALLTLCVLVGALKLAVLLTRLARFCWRHFARPANKPSAYGQWAVVTGATDGIGRAYCNALAEQGLNIYLISRTESKLVDAADQIKKAHNVETKYFVADLAKSGEQSDAGACWFGLKSNLDGLDVGILVNNAGMSYEHPEFLHSVDAEAVSALLAINIGSLTKMVQVVLPGMKERGRGCIVNISSGTASALPASPLLAVYAASKAYVDALTRSLAAEYAHFGVHIQAQAPNFVATKMAKMRRTSLMVPSPDQYVAAAVKHLGYEPWAVPYWPHALMCGVLSMVPQQVLVPYWFNMMSKMRARALKKKAASKAQ